MTGNRHNEVQVERGEAADRGEGGGKQQIEGRGGGVTVYNHMYQ